MKDEPYLYGLETSRVTMTHFFKYRFLIKIHLRLLEENQKLNTSLLGMQYIPSTSKNYGPAGLQNQYCQTHACYTPTEFALFGVGICIAGKIFYSVKMQPKCSRNAVKMQSKCR